MAAKPTRRSGKSPAQSPGKSKSAKRSPKKGTKSKPRDAVVERQDHGARGLPKIRMPGKPDEVHRNTADRGAFKEKDFEAFFTAEIEAELSREATLFNDRVARWRCQCCDAVIPVPRRTTVYHGDYVLEHDDVEGLLVNGAKFVPRANTPVEVVQPGRLRNPFTGRVLADEGYEPVDLGKP